MTRYLRLDTRFTQLVPSYIEMDQIDRDDLEPTLAVRFDTPNGLSSDLSHSIDSSDFPNVSVNCWSRWINTRSTCAITMRVCDNDLKSLRMWVRSSIVGKFVMKINNFYIISSSRFSINTYKTRWNHRTLPLEFWLCYVWFLFYFSYFWYTSFRVGDWCAKITVASFSLVAQHSLHRCFIIRSIFIHEQTWLFHWVKNLTMKIYLPVKSQT